MDYWQTLKSSGKTRNGVHVRVPISQLGTDLLHTSIKRKYGMILANALLDLTDFNFLNSQVSGVSS